MKASIIIPSYNAKDRLRLNLASLNAQDYHGNDVEVIVIDNGSTDDTMQMLEKIKLKLPLTTLRIEKNRGIAGGRNQGIIRAKGDILIFHDSDMIASKDFISKHLMAHTQENTVVCGLFWKRLYSFYYENFSEEQIKKLQEYVPMDTMSTYENGHQIISDETLISKNVDKYSFDLDIDFIKGLKEVIKEYGIELKNYYLPWRFFITNNLSVDRKAVLDAHLFDEKIIKYGYEDYDLGVRLYKAGCRFVLADDIISIHQEHPQNFSHLDLMENLNYISEKYNDIHYLDFHIVCLSNCIGIDNQNLNDITKEINYLIGLKQYYFILDILLQLLQIISKKLFAPEEDKAIAMFPHIARNMPKIVMQSKELKWKHHSSLVVNLLCNL